MNTLWSTDAVKLHSQGIITSPDKRLILYHDSTYPTLLHKLEYGNAFQKGINMDRGGFGIRKDGSLFACLFDGTGGGGIDSAYAAQDFTQKMLHELMQNHLPVEDKNDVINLLLNCSRVHNPLALHGDATCVAVDISQNELKAIALGDSGIIHIDGKTKKAHLFETILKDDRTNTQDTGGCISRGGFLYRQDNTCLFSTAVSNGDYIILASDGLLDNLPRGDEDAALSLIINNSFFDREVALPLQHELPDLDTLFSLYQESYPTSSLQIIKRLNAYIRAITHEKHLALKSCLEQWEEAKNRSDRDAIRELTKNFKQINQRLAGKCDDCLLLCLEV